MSTICNQKETKCMIVFIAFNYALYLQGPYGLGAVCSFVGTYKPQESEVIMRIGILTKLVVLGVILTLLPLLAIWGINIYQGTKAISFAGEETRQLALGNLENSVSGVYSMLVTQQELLEKVVEGNLNVTFELAKEYGEVQIGDGTWDWKAINQYTKDATQISLPQMYIGSDPIKQLSDFSQASALVDNIGKLVGGTCTIFQRMDDAGSMLRVATNVEKLDGTRATGTYIPAVNPNGKPNPVIKKIMAGERFVGRAYVANAWYVTAYEGIQDANGDIIGVLYYGVREDSAESLREQILNIEIGKSGYVYVLDSDGKMVISPKGENDGESVIDAKDANGQAYVQEIVNKATQLAPGELENTSYTLEKNGNAEEMVAEFAYFKKWNWIIVATGQQKELFNLVRRLEKLNQSNLNTAVIVLVVSLVLIMGIWILVARRFVSPIKDATMVAHAIAEGNLDTKVNVRSDDEIGSLGESLNTMAQKLKETMRKAEQKSEEAEREAEACRHASEVAEEAARKAEDAKREGMIQASERIDEVANRLQRATDSFLQRVQQANDGARTQSARADETATAMEEMNTAVLDVARNASSSAESSDKAKSQASYGSEVVSQVVAAISQVQDKAQELKNNMDDLDRQAEAIDQVMNVITDIADQTNLLALNAAIEAARAGEAGRGFAVVADEVRKLAEKTMAATKEVGNTVAGIQDSTRQNVQQVEQAVELVAHATELAEKSGGALREIVLLVDNVTDQVRSIATASEEQSATSEEINRSFTEINDISQETAHIMEEASDAVDELSKLLESLQRIIAELRSE